VQRIKKSIEQLERLGSTYVPGITKFSDVSPEEFRQKMLLPNYAQNNTMPCNVGSVNQKTIKPIEVRELPTVDVPAEWDWRTKGAVTGIKNQGSVGTCWAFSTTGNIEGQWFLAGNELVSLSEEQLNDCDSYDCGVFGGWPCRAYQYVVQAGGLISESEYPYCVGNGSCFPCSPPNYNLTFCGPGPEFCNKTRWPCKAHQGSDFAAHITGWKTFGTNETELIAQLVANGPLSVLMNAEGLPPLQDHIYGIYDPWSCDPTGLDHAVLLVGYGSQDDSDYWIVKNSWGTDWGDSGYFLISRGSGTCGINTAVTSAIV